MEIPIKKLTESAIIPTRAFSSDAGYDLYSTEYYTLKPFERRVFKTGIALAIPEGYYGRLAPRSGLAVKNGIDVLAGVVDSTYRNEIGVVLINLNVLDSVKTSTSSNIFSAFFNTVVGEFTVKPGDRIAQIIIEKCHDIEFKLMDKLPESDRNLGGFGSTGN